MQNLAALFGAVAMAGCGGASGGSPMPSGSNVSVYAGSYSGGWSWPYHGEDGSTAGTITSAGQVSLVENDAVEAGSFYVLGSVGSSGVFSGTFEVAGGQTPVRGSIYRGAQGQLILAFPVVVSGVSYMNRATIAPASPVPFVGSCTGTWSSTSDPQGGAASFSIGAGGETVGSYVNAIGDVIPLSGIVSGSGHFSGAVLASGHYFGATGSFSLSGGEVSGTIIEAVSGNVVTVRFVAHR